MYWKIDLFASGTAMSLTVLAHIHTGLTPWTFNPLGIFVTDAQCDTQCDTHCDTHCDTQFDTQCDTDGEAGEATQIGR